jgi:isopentenyl-diphosphate delta-isomerase
MEEQVILVNELDGEIGVMAKLAAHQTGVLHRAFSVFVFNSENELLLQRRALQKYHSAGLWSNTCCSHPRPGENIKYAAKRRLLEEMGLSCELTEVFSFIYKVQLENGLSEHEFDHVFVGYSNSKPKPDSEEVVGWVYLSQEVLREEIAAYPHNYSEWFKLCITKWDTELFNKKHNL